MTAPRRLLHPLVVVVLAAGVLVAACGPGADASPSSATGGDAVDVVATTTIFADMVRQVGGDRVRVESLVPKGGEVHTFDPTPSDVRRVTDAELVVRNGLGLDDWLAGLVADAGTDAPVVALAEDLDGVTLLEGAGHEDEGEGEEFNPHLWMNVAYAALYADRIAEALTAVDPDGSAAYAEGLAAYRETLAELDAYAQMEIGAVPEANRNVVAFHDAFPYFAAAYGLTIDGTIVDAPGQDPSAGEIADLVRAIRTNKVAAIFAEAQFNDDLVTTIADETGVPVISSLYTDTVGDAPLDTYEAVMRWNVDEVVAALSGE
jgi:zinc/manganese transport system substrate-binding protein/manganese/iron transport system substrate-binding protein